MNSPARLPVLLALFTLFVGCSVTELPPRGEDGGEDGGELDAGLDGGEDGGLVGCTFGDDLTCSTHDWEPEVGRCGSDGLCYCTAYEYFRDPATGLCRWGECDMIRQDCPDPGDGCYPPGDGLGYPHCLPAGTTANGQRCLTSPDCTKGSTCEVGRRICAQMCDPEEPSCPAWQECQLRWARMGMPGLCL
ncbi:MAG: hypothetical protein P1V51_23470 [Deltaproteobacteria bacterium]|nr:hypothetical protein [Deltaproteobacteria bacterium]